MKLRDDLLETLTNKYMWFISHITRNDIKRGHTGLMRIAYIHAMHSYSKVLCVSTVNHMAE